MDNSAKPKDATKAAFKYLMLALPLFFIGPSVIYNAFQNRQNLWHYLVLAIGIAMCFGAIFCTFKGIHTLVKGLFDKKR